MPKRQFAFCSLPPVCQSLDKLAGDARESFQKSVRGVVMNGCQSSLPFTAAGTTLFVVLE